MQNQILLGDCLDVLKTLPDESVDSCVTDVPYGLGTREPTLQEIIGYLQGAELDHGDFMGHKWSVPSVAVWREVFRVLKPGGHAISFGGTRTWDLISLGLRAAGFENRDTIASNFAMPALQWQTGQGFPKSSNIFKNLVKSGVPHEDAAAFEGLGTALKPSWEPALLFRKPLSESTVAKQVLKTGTGAINIDGCRVGIASSDLAEMTGRSGASTENAFPGASKEGTWQPTSSGRWPSNVVLSHSENCRRTGSKKVDAPVINRFVDGAKPFGNGAGHEYESEQRGDAEGKEEVAVYECQEGCPVKTLDDQSGISKPDSRGSRRSQSAQPHNQTYEGGPWRGAQTGSDAVDEAPGGASRFFPQFEQEQEPYDCVEGCPVKTLDDQSGILKTSGGTLNRAGIGYHSSAKGNEGYVPPSEGGASRFFPQFEQEAPYECVEGCPVKTLDEQSGELSVSGSARKGSPTSRPATDIGFTRGVEASANYIAPNDEGGASRFFPQFEQESFECVEGCPVKTLDEQSGELHTHPGQIKESMASMGFHGGSGSARIVESSSGGASRFFPQFEQLKAPFMYATKVSKRERDEGLPKGTNTHPTVKNLSLMRWLCRLVTPKGGTILDPYAGSGSTLVAALKEGFNFIGIERDPEFHRIATMRVEAATPKRDLFDDMEDL